MFEKISRVRDKRKTRKSHVITDYAKRKKKPVGYVRVAEEDLKPPKMANENMVYPVHPKQIWEMQPHETAKAYEVFMIFLHMGAVRSAEKASEVSGVNIDTVKRWQGSNGWMQRVRAFTEHWSRELNNKVGDEKIERIQQMEERHMTNFYNYQNLIKVSATVLSKKLNTDKGMKEFESMSTPEQYRLFLSAIKIFSDMVDGERKSIGLPSTIAQNNSTNRNLNVNSPFLLYDTEAQDIINQLLEKTHGLQGNGKAISGAVSVSSDGGEI